MSTIDKKEAPRDYIAVENPQNSYGCEFCAFNLGTDVFCHLTEKTSFPEGGCSAEYRQDSTDVHFILDENGLLDKNGVELYEGYCSTFRRRKVLRI